MKERRERDEGSCGRGLHPMLLDRIPSRTRVKKEGKRMSFIFQFLIVSRSWQLFWQSKKGSYGWFWERKSKSNESDGLLFYLVETKKSLGFVCFSFKNFS
jgi:hypothetical protein